VRWRARTVVQQHDALRARRPQLKRDPLGSATRCFHPLCRLPRLLLLLSWAALVSLQMPFGSFSLLGRVGGGRLRVGESSLRSPSQAQLVCHGAVAQPWSGTQGSFTNTPWMEPLIVLSVSAFVVTGRQQPAPCVSPGAIMLATRSRCGTIPLITSARSLNRALVWQTTHNSPPDLSCLGSASQSTRGRSALPNMRLKLAGARE
jgi:hypothetical protein